MVIIHDVLYVVESIAAVSHLNLHQGTSMSIITSINIASENAVNDLQNLSPSVVRV